MPTYAYVCTDCGHEFEIVQAITDGTLTQCPQCQGALRKVFHPVGVAFKGSGFYRTDSRAGSGTDAAKPAAKSGDAGTSGDKSAAKSSDSSSSGGSSESGSSGASKSGDKSGSGTSGSSSSGSSTKGSSDSS